MVNRLLTWTSTPQILPILLLILSLTILQQFQNDALLRNVASLELTRVTVSNRQSDQSAIRRAASSWRNVAQRDEHTGRATLIADWLDRTEHKVATVLQNQSSLLTIQAGWSRTNLDEQIVQQLESLSNNGWIEASLVLLEHFQFKRLDQLAEQMTERLAGWQPQYLLTDPSPYSGWNLIGYDWFPLDSMLSSNAYLVLYWENPEPEYQSDYQNIGSGRYLIGNRMLQIITAQNVLSNGDFEWLPHEHLTSKPVFFELMFLSEDLGTDAYQVIHNSDEGNSYLHVTNQKGELILFRYIPPITDQHLYLQVGRLRSNGVGFLGFREFLDGKNKFSMVCRRLHNEDWDVYAQIVAPDPRSREHYVYFGASETDFQGWADFDDLGLFPIADPFDQDIK